jgi:hypothetical protein
MDALSFVKLVVLGHADALREKGVLRLEVDGCKVEFAPLTAPAPVGTGEEGEKAPDFDLSDVKLRAYDAPQVPPK